MSAQVATFQPTCWPFSFIDLTIVFNLGHSNLYNVSGPELSPVILRVGRYMYLAT